MPNCVSGKTTIERLPSVKVRLFCIALIAIFVSGCGTLQSRAVRQHPNTQQQTAKTRQPLPMKESVVTASGKNTSSNRRITLPAPARTQVAAKPSPKRKGETKQPLAVSLQDALKANAIPLKEAQYQSKYATVWEHLSANLEFTSLTDRKEVEAVEDWYAKHSYYLNKIGGRAGRYLYHILDRAQAKGLPADLALVPLIESAFDPFAYSHGQASGLWQFVPITAKHVGLKQDWWYDERRDVIASTDAALDYLASLNKRFDGDWLLTLAAYNSGAGTVNRAIKKNRKKGRSTDFWSLNLPKETKSYIPKLLAMVSMFRNPAAYNISLPKVPDGPRFSVVDTGGQIDLKQAAKLAGISVDELYHLNPGMNRGITPPDGPHRLLIPMENAGRFKTRLASIAKEDRVRWQRYKVKSGDNLSKIAKLYHTSQQALRTTNNLQGDMLKIGQELLIPDSNDTTVYAINRGAGKQQNRLVYKVLPGDTLGHIALRYEVSVKDLRRWNKLGRDGVIKVGQKLEIWAEQPAQDGVVRKVGYRVRSGDSLSAIASRFSVKVSDIVQWNSINPGNYLKPGQSLTLFVDVTRAGL